MPKKNTDKSKNTNKGITMIEVLLVIGLLAIVASFGLFMSMDSYNNSSFHNERNLLVAALMHARGQALHNTCLDTTSTPCTDGKAHGLHIDNDSQGIIIRYVIFQGTTYDPADSTNEIIKVNHPIKVSGATDIDFAQLSASVSVPLFISISDGNGLGSSVINIGSEGQIYWSN